ncbi:hypothetical protein SNE510_65800 [Streptomyces sp. NE5-10]|uniref:hypothetical protein n=1 Tax=Streptomyces sp. NE5-10 TaxID=2759674 RepID=UPI001907094A|nr:hypothetical protein [Streptomyces sp. NE5-10]GHJ97061.1 hypothetical protein SNE510_65800 [Streptomyces sp. NE5-10]
MDALQQHLFDSYRAARRGESAPPAPGTHDVAVLRELRDHRRFERVVAGRPATGRFRAALSRLLARLSGARTPGGPVRPS